MATTPRTFKAKNVKLRLADGNVVQVAADVEIKVEFTGDLGRVFAESDIRLMNRALKSLVVIKGA